MSDPYPTFDDYWLAYLVAHSKAGTRLLHYVGTVIGLFVAPLAGLAIRWWLFPVFVLFGYGIALVAHPLMQNNRPFAAKPLWGFVADLRMLWLALAGQLTPHLVRAAARRSGL